MKKLLEIQNLQISFPAFGGELHAVRGISFDIYEGESLALVGESGCGKSVTAKALMGLISASNGNISKDSHILYKGKNILSYNKNQWSEYCGKDCAMIFQDAMAALNPTIRIGNQIAENLIVHQKISKKEADKKAVKALSEVGISQPEERALQYPHEFSGGMRQRCMIAMAMVCRPALLIADEPTTALDVTIQSQILDLMKKLKEENHMALLLITHDLGVVAGIADRTAVMYAGQIIEIGKSREIYYTPRHPYTFSLLKAVPKLNTSGRHRLPAIDGMPPDLSEPLPGCPFADRCRYCMQICTEEMPPRYEFEENHFTACWLHDPSADTKNCEIKTGGGKRCEM